MSLHILLQFALISLWIAVISATGGEEAGTLTPAPAGGIRVLLPSLGGGRRALVGPGATGSADHRVYLAGLQARVTLEQTRTRFYGPFYTVLRMWLESHGAFARIEPESGDPAVDEKFRVTLSGKNFLRVRRRS